MHLNLFKTSLFYLSFCFAMLTLNIITIDAAAATSSKIFDNEAEVTLQQNPETSLSTVLEQFEAKGGTLIRLADDATPFQFLMNDVIFPSCSGGNNRSQTLYAVLSPYADKIVINLPYATRYGFDPYNNQTNWVNNHLPTNDEFELWAGTPKQTKFAWKEFAAWLGKTEATEEELAVMREYHNREYFSPSLPEGTRRIYITFAQNAHVHLYRLAQTNDSLENVFLLYYPMPDLICTPHPEWHTKPQAQKAYVELSALLRLFLDFSQL